MTFFRHGATLLAILFLAPGSPVRSEVPAAARRGDALPPGVVARLGSMRLRHDQAIGRLAFSPDSKTLAVLTYHPNGNALWVWDVATGEKVRRLDLGSERYSRASYSPDRRCIAMTDGEQVRLVDTASGKVFRRFERAGQQITCLAFSPDGKLLAAGCQSNRISQTSEILLWETAGRKEPARLEGHKTAVDTIAFSGDGNRLFSSSQDHKGIAGTRFPDTIPGAVCIWDVPGGKLSRRLRSKGARVVFAPDGKAMACSDESGFVHLWDLEADRERAKLEGGWPSYLFSPDGKTLITGGQRQMLTVWDASTARRLRAFRGHLGKGVHPAAISSDRKTLATVGDPIQIDKSVRLWDVATGEERRPFAGHADSVTCVAFAPDGLTLISGSEDHTLRVWDATGGAERRIYARHKAAIAAVLFSPDGKTVASGDAANAVHLWDPATGKQLRRLSAAPDSAAAEKTGVRCLAFAPDGKRLFSGSMALNIDGGEIAMRGLVAAWDAATGEKLQARKEEGHRPIALTDDGRHVASAGFLLDRLSFEEPLSLRRTFANRDLARMEKGGGSLSRVTFSPDGRILAVYQIQENGGLFGGRSNSVTRAQLLEVATGKTIVALAQGGSAMAFSPDGRFLAATSPEKKNLVLLSAATGRMIAELPSHPGGAVCCAFSPDGGRLATGGADQNILIRDVSQFRLDKTLPRVDADRENLDKLWADLADADASRAYRAGWGLTAVPEQSIPLLRERLKPAAAMPAGVIERHIRDLDSNEFAVRERANAALEKAGELAEPALRETLAGQPSLELRQRVKRLLDRLDAAAPTPEHLQMLRAIAVLERVGSTEARQVLKALAEGAPGANRTEEAKASLRRLHRRMHARP